MTPDDLARIKAATGISAVLSLQHDECLAYWKIDYCQMDEHGANLGLDMVRSPMRDFNIVDQKQNLPYAVAALAKLQMEGHRTYVHCTAGLGRAPLTTLGYLSWVDGKSAEEAIRLIHSGRPNAVPAWEAFHGCREDLIRKYRERIEQRAYELHELRAGSHGDSDTDWFDAEREILRSALIGFDT